MRSESGVLSFDFLAGFAIFSIALIAVITILSGLLIHLQTQTIDLDAVAYRTSVILVEDPGEPAIAPPAGRAAYTHIDETKLWERRPVVDIQRLGLSCYKSTPRILSEEKVKRFFNNANPIYENLGYLDYHTKLIFDRQTGVGERYLYHFNITFISLENPPLYFYSAGDPIPENLIKSPNYGYIKRFAMVRIPFSSNTAESASYASYNWAIPEFDSFKGPFNEGTGYYEIDLPPIINLTTNITRGAVYSVDPTLDGISFNITNISKIINQNTTQNPVGKAEIYDVIYMYNISGLARTIFDIPIYIDGSSTPVDPYIFPAGGIKTANLSIKINVSAGFFETRGVDLNNPSLFRVIFNPTTLDLTASKTENGWDTTTPFPEYSYLNPGISPRLTSYLVPCVIEVRIW